MRWRELCYNMRMYHLMTSIRRTAAAALSLAFAAGCQSYSIVQKNVFVDEDGNVVTVEYGRSSREHVNTFIAPTTGKKMDFRSKLVVCAELPDGTSFTAWQCMNFFVRGTMYKTDNERWMLLADGFTCVVYRQTKEDETRYKEVYRGVLCDTPDVGAAKRKKDDRWRTLPSDPHTSYKKAEDRPQARK